MQANSKEKSTRPIAFAVSPYCEKARWALERLNIPFIEERHVPGFHWLITRPNGGKSVPLLLTKAGTFTDSTDILQYLDAIAPTSQLESRAIAESSDYYENQLHGRRCLNHRSKLGDKLKHI